MLQVKNIVKSYRTGEFTQVALDNVSLNFRESEFVAILGQSGSGKTTFLNVIGGLDQYDSGDLIINGKSTKDFKDSEWDAYRNNSVGFVFQSYNLIPHLSILDNVEMGMTLSGVSSGEKRQKAMEVLERVGLKDHLHKKPNQLSGGQMQRVAIARALANNPDIILADEPTGALDTETSAQIMDLIKEIAQDKLVVMVTHNADLAERYAGRIVRFSDGKVISDSNPVAGQDTVSDYALKKTSMSFFTALKLSGKNIATKKWRTALTAFASSIGIIGIALVLSLSNGFNKQIASIQSNTLSNYPITITQSTSEREATAPRENLMKPTDTAGEYPNVQVIYPHDPNANLQTHTNVFTDDYIAYLHKMDSSLLAGISYTRLVNMNLLMSDGKTATPVSPAAINFTEYPSGANKEGKSYLETNYDLLAGSFPQNKNDLVLIVDNKNQLDTSIVKALGWDSQAKEINFNDIVGYELKAVPNDDYYVQRGSYFSINGSADNLSALYSSPDAISMKIVGVIRPNKDASIATTSAGISYSDELATDFINNAKNSAIVKAQENADYNVLTGAVFTADQDKTGEREARAALMGGNGATGISPQTAATKDDALAVLGANAVPYTIMLYPTNFNAKDQITAYLDDWNQGKDTSDQIVYTDMAATITSLIGNTLDAITLVLVAFAAISLVVSLIMIGIITYISVLERIKEIGVLRALGARKKDISRVFNAETFIIGACSGLLGIGIAYLLTVPVNIVLKRMSGLDNVAQLNPLHALLLVVISVLLTMLGGVIPARMAAKKDPVEALRTE